MRHFIRAAVLALLPISAQAQQVTLGFQCDLGGAPAQMVMAVQYQQAFNPLHNFKGQISGIFPAGVTVYTAGQVQSANAYYTFRGENDFADFTDGYTNDRFRVKWTLDAARNGVWMTVNPFGGAVTYFCALTGAQ